MLVTDILPRKGPAAFDCFVKELYVVNPKVADILLKDSGLKGNLKSVNKTNLI